MAKSIKLGSDTYLDTTGLAQDGKPIEQVVRVFKQTTTSEGGYRYFSITANRLSGLLFYVGNTGGFGCWGIEFKQAGRAVATKLFGNVTDNPLIGTDGSLRTPNMAAWSACYFWTNDVGVS